MSSSKPVGESPEAVSHQPVISQTQPVHLQLSSRFSPFLALLLQCGLELGATGGVHTLEMAHMWPN